MKMIVVLCSALAVFLAIAMFVWRCGCIMLVLWIVDKRIPLPSKPELRELAKRVLRGEKGPGLW